MNLFKKIALLCLPWVLVACSTMPTKEPLEKALPSSAPATVAPAARPQEVPIVKPVKVPVDSVAKAPPALLSLLQRAQQQEKNGDNQSAASSLERAIRMAPRYPESYYRLGELRYREGVYRQAASLAQKTLSLGAQGALRGRAEDLLNRANGH